MIRVVGILQSFGLLTAWTDFDQTDSKQKEKISCKGQSIAQFFHFLNYLEHIYDELKGVVVNIFLSAVMRNFSHVHDIKNFLNR